MSARPPAAGVRLAWSGLPPHVRAAVEDRAGAAVVSARDQRGGFSPGVAARLALSDNRRLFVKTVAPSINPRSVALCREEARTLAILPAEVPAPRLLWTCEAGEWVVLAIEDVEGSPPSLPWRRETLDRVVGALSALAAVRAPSSLPTVVELLSPQFTGWRTIAGDPPPDLGPWERRHLPRLAELEASWPAYAAGDALLHLDLRADNVILGPGGAVHFVDWAHAAAGAAWVDLALLLLEVDLPAGELDEILSTAGAPSAGVDALVCAFAGLLSEHGRRPAPPGLPTIREYQRATAQMTIDRLALRTGWP